MKSRLIYHSFRSVFAAAVLISITPVVWSCPQIPQSQSQLLEARRLNDEMENFARQERYVEATARAERLLSILVQVLGPEDIGVARLLNNLAGYYRQTGTYNQAEVRYRRCLAIVEKKLGSDHPTTVLVLNNLAGLYRLMGDYVRSEQFYKRTLTAAERGSGPASAETAKALQGLGVFYSEKGDYEQAETFFRRALTLFETLPRENTALAQTLNSLALLQRAKLNYAEAETVYKRAITVAERSTEDQLILSAALSGLGGIYEDQGDLTRAGMFYERALRVVERTFGPDHQFIATALNNLGLLYMKQGNIAQGRSILERALAIHEKKYGPDSIQLFSPLLNLAIMYFHAGEVATAFNFLNRSFNIREQSLDLVLKAGSEKQKQLYLATLGNETDGIISMMIQAGPNNSEMSELGLTTILRRKARALDAVSKQFETLRSQVNPQHTTLLNDLAEARTRLANVMLLPSSDTSEAYRSNLEKEVEQLEQLVPGFSSLYRQEMTAVTVSRVQSAIPAGAALVEFVSYKPFNTKALTVSDRFGERRYAAFVLRRTGKPIWTEIGDTKVIDASVNQLRSAFKDKKSINAKLIARALDEQVMQPVRALLGDVHQILVSPDGVLNLLPFGALVDEQNRYLLENYSITYLTSGRDLLLTTSTGNQKFNRPLIVANPLFDTTSSERSASPQEGSRSIDFTKFKYAPLPATALEAKEIAAVLNNAEVLTEANATESAVKKATQPQVLHLATHGFFLSDQKEPDGDGRTLVRDRQRPATLENPLLRSGIILAGVTQRNSGPGEDGVLSALEAASLDLRGTELVVLSACDTGIGDIRVGDGVLGLRRALLLAGAKSQVTSLWQVDDAATRELMVDFYTRLKQGEGKGEALRNAQLNMLRSAGCAHPYFWASFIEIGDWRPLN